MNYSEKKLLPLIKNIVLELLQKQQDILTLDLATKIATACVCKAQELNLNVSIAICDKHGNLMLFYRMEGSLLVSSDVAPKKAYTSVSLNMSTEDTKPFMDKYAPQLDKITEDKLVFFGGGLPIRINNELVGGLGISGSSSKQDIQIAVYGLKSTKLFN